MAPNVTREALMNDACYVRRVTLGFRRVSSRTRSMRMLTIALQVQMFTQGRVDVCHAPRFLDGHTSGLTALGNETIHTPIEIGKLKAMPIQGSHHSLIGPISTATWPFYKDSHTQGYSKRRYFNYFPELSEVSPVTPDQRLRRAAAVHTNI